MIRPRTASAAAGRGTSPWRWCASRCVDVWAVGALLIAASSISAFAAHHRHTTHPFIPRVLLGNRGYLRLTALGFTITLANLAAQIGYPFVLTGLDGLSTLAVGIALVPAALVTAVVGLIAGRVVDHAGPRVPIRIGVSSMLAATVALSASTGTGPWTLAALAVVFGAGFALVNTPLAATVSRLVEPQDLAAALSLNTMMFFIGGSFGATLFTSVATTTADRAAWNPLHSGAGAGFSNAFLTLAAPIALGLLLSRSMAPRQRAATEAPSGGNDHGQWTAPCDVPWSPDLEPSTTATPTGATRV